MMSHKRRRGTTTSPATTFTGSPNSTWRESPWELITKKIRACFFSSSESQVNSRTSTRPFLVVKKKKAPIVSLHNPGAHWSRWSIQAFTYGETWTCTFTFGESGKKFNWKGQRCELCHLPPFKERKKQPRPEAICGRFSGQTKSLRPWP